LRIWQDLSIQRPAVRRMGAPIRAFDDGRTTMEYMILIYGDERAWANVDEAQHASAHLLPHRGEVLRSQR
jgi:hypothetical protein